MSLTPGTKLGADTKSAQELIMGTSLDKPASSTSLQTKNEQC